MNEKLPRRMDTSAQRTLRSRLLAALLFLMPAESSAAQPSVPSVPASSEGTRFVAMDVPNEHPATPVEAMTWQEKLDYLQTVEYNLPSIVVNALDPKTGELRLNWKTIMDPLTLKFGYETAAKLLNVEVLFEHAPDFISSNPTSDEAYRYVGEQLKKELQNYLFNEVVGISLFSDEMRDANAKNEFFRENMPRVESVAITGHASVEGETPSSITHPETSEKNMQLAEERAQAGMYSVMHVLPLLAFDRLDPQNIITEAVVHPLDHTTIEELAATAKRNGFAGDTPSESIFRLVQAYNDGTVDTDTTRTLDRIFGNERKVTFSFTLSNGKQGAVLFPLGLLLELGLLPLARRRLFPTARERAADQDAARREAQRMVDEVRR